MVFNCLAVHVDLSPDYSDEKFRMVLRRFVSLRGYPAKLRSDNGTQLTAANEELQTVTRAWKWTELKEFGVTEGMKWDFASADAPWQNGCSEALIFLNLVNERPIGHPEYQVVPSKRQPLRTAPSRIRPENRRCALEEMDSRSFPQSDRAAKVAHGSVKPDGG